jgi:hypothetical protein
MFRSLKEYLLNNIKNVEEEQKNLDHNSEDKLRFSIPNKAKGDPDLVKCARMENEI